MKEAPAIYTSAIIAGILARDCMERDSEAQLDFLSGEVFDDHKAQNAEAEAKGFHKIPAKWVARFSYHNIETGKSWQTLYWTEEFHYHKAVVNLN